MIAPDHLLDMAYDYLQHAPRLQPYVIGALGLVVFAAGLVLVRAIIRIARIPAEPSEVQYQAWELE